MKAPLEYKIIILKSKTKKQFYIFLNIKRLKYKRLKDKIVF